MENQAYVLSVVTENTLRVLQRMAGLFARHRVNIEQLNVCGLGASGFSAFSIVVYSAQPKVVLLVKQLERIVEVKNVSFNQVKTGE